MKLYLSSILPIFKIHRRQKNLFPHMLNTQDGSIDQADGVIYNHIFSRRALDVNFGFLTYVQIKISLGQYIFTNTLP